MTLSLQEISARFELQDLVFRYSEIVDRKAFEELREIFTEDARIDYRGTGGVVGNLEQTIGFLHSALGIFPNHQHLVSNTQFTIDGDKAIGKVMCLNPMEMKVEEGTHTFLLGLWYLDEFVRTADGWFFITRSQEASWNLNLPPQMMTR